MATFNDCTGNILVSPCQALVNPVNCFGAMGSGLALAFKTFSPYNFERYRAACKAKEVKIGQMFVTEIDVAPVRYIVNFPTKFFWKEPSNYYYVAVGLKALHDWILKNKITSIAIPRLGCGLGGLDWAIVKDMVWHALKDLDCKIDLH